MTISLAASSRNSSSFGNEAIRDQFAVGFAPLEKSALLHAARAAGFSAKEMTEVGLVSRPRGGGPLQDRFRGRLMFPICDMQGRVLGFGERELGNGRGPKYVNSPASAIYCKSDLLYGAHQARAAAAKARAVVVVEGYIDVLAMHQASIVNTVGLMGTAVSEHQIAGLKRLAPTAVLMLDGDEAGTQAILRTGALAAPAGLEVLVASLPSGCDPAALVQRHGAEAAHDIVTRAIAFARFRVQHQIDSSDLSTAEAKDRLVDELRDVFIDIPPSAVREDLIALVATHLGLEPALVGSWMPTRDIAAGGQPVVAEKPSAAAFGRGPSRPQPAGAVRR